MPLIPFKKILAPVDFSPFSFKSLQNAADLASHFGAELCVLHITQPTQNMHYLAPYAPDPNLVTSQLENQRKAAQGSMQMMVEKLKTPFEVSYVLREGAAADEIVNAARDEGTDLIVISTHGIGGWRHLMFGLVAEKVIRLAPCPVLVTHAEKPVN